jgi:glycosyltransferase involved in cell wall biosynthesis
VDLTAWAKTICQTFDVALCPLAATSFNQSKSRLKAIESMAVGVPWVGSPREEYRRLNRESGCGTMANTPKEWATAVRTLMKDESLRQEQAEKGRAYMSSQTYQAQAWQWMETWEEALKIQRGGA